MEDFISTKVEEVYLNQVSVLLTFPRQIYTLSRFFQRLAGTSWQKSISVDAWIIAYYNFFDKNFKKT